jgi:hypothetical protein
MMEKLSLPQQTRILIAIVGKQAKNIKELSRATRALPKNKNPSKIDFSIAPPTIFLKNAPRHE